MGSSQQGFHQIGRIMNTISQQIRKHIFEQIRIQLASGNYPVPPAVRNLIYNYTTEYVRIRMANVANYVYFQAEPQLLI